MWRVEAPKQANAHDYLMHELLAFAALHKAYQQPLDQRQPYYACGIHHQDLAIRGVRERLHNVTDDEAPAIVATSTLLTLSVFASTGFEAQTAPTAAAVNDIDSIMNAFHLMQGMGHVLALAQAAVRESFVGPMLRDPTEPSASQPMLQDLKDHLPALIKFIEGKTDLPEVERKLYLTTITYFEPALQVSLPPWVDNRELRFLFFWPLHLDPEFMECLRQRRSGAIAILMHFAIVLIAAEPRYWFMEEWGHRVMKACYEVIDQSWLSAAQWPLSFLSQGQTWDLFANLASQGQSSGPSTFMSSTVRQPTVIPRQQPTPMGSSTSHTETSQPFSLQLQGTKYTVQMGSAVDKPVPDED
ncbi:hypothetical protein G6011_09376 [Alternaria panax]|uniref:Uncharacterized protein n=1 Tax=Alternaria panax TaxID=48097 RepID=A0AAD4NNY7_9PLEO|nr:hypothetical protein G6011_09376 [Alternaria panax]